MTRYLFWEDSYAREFETQVMSASGNEIILNSTCFYPSSGGQPSDTGTINGIDVIDVRKREDGEIVHTLQSVGGIGSGDTVKGILDWDRRYRLMRLHSAGHVVSGILSKNFGVRKHTGIQIYEDRVRMGFDIARLDKEVSTSIESEFNRVVAENHQIVAKMLTWELVNSDSSLKTVSEDRYEKIDVPRVLDIVGFDKQLDGGTHVRSTGEIGEIEIIGRENKGRNDKRIIFTIRGL
ncbi:MAG: alanyl-tRNA editing protein [Candidatus Thermoplasmatota archaeon]|nr:alanyl-tRNA editing protein [Candidatus Thermoplasmatota archaeon]